MAVRIAISSKVTDAYWADFLFGTTSAYSLAQAFEAHLRQSLDSVYVQDDWKVLPNLTLNLGLRWEYGSPYSEKNNLVSNWDPGSQTVFTINPSVTTANAAYGITPTSGSGVYGKTLINPDRTDFAPRIGFAYAPLSTWSIRGGFGTGYVHYTRAGSGDIAAINAPQAQFASVTQIAPTTSNHCSTPLPAQIITTGTTKPSCYATAAQGFPSGLVTSFNYATDNITWVPRNTRDSYVENYYLAVQHQITKNSLVDIAYVGNHGLKLQQFLNGNQRNINVAQTTSTTTVYSRPFTNWPSDITEALNESYSNYNALEVKYEQRMVAGLTLLDSFTWEHSLDNASASLEGNTPSPQDANNLKAEYAQSDYNLPIANIASLVYDLPFGRGRTYGHNMNPIADGVLGGWQVSAIDTAQAGTPFNLTYSPNSNQACLDADFGQLPWRQSLPAECRARSSAHAGTQRDSLARDQQRRHRVYPVHQLQRGRDTSRQECRRRLSAALRRHVAQPRPHPAALSNRSRLQQALQNAQRRLADRVPFRVYNIFNHTNLYLPSTTGGTQGANASTGGLISSTFTPRVVQFALKVIY